MTRIKQLKSSEVEKLLKQYGFVKVSQKGSHAKWYNPNTKKKTNVPVHKGKTIPVGTLKSLMESAGIPEHEWKSEH